MSNERPRHDGSLIETVSVDIVYVTNARNDEGGHSVTCLDADTGKVIGSLPLPPAADGPRRITFGDFAELMGDTCRCTSVLVVIEKQMPARQSCRASDMLCRGERGWLRHGGRRRHVVAFESPLEADFLAKASS
jgi:hypothetical protein